VFPAAIRRFGWPKAGTGTKKISHTPDWRDLDLVVRAKSSYKPRINSRVGALLETLKASTDGAGQSRRASP
jgi:hypothetical protein